MSASLNQATTYSHEREADPAVDKISVARAQHGTALDLFVRNKDPVSIQCLACGGGEIMEALAEAHGEQPLALHLLRTQPELDRRELRI